MLETARYIMCTWFTLMLIYWVDACVLYRNEALLFGSKEYCLEVNAEKTEYVFMSRNQSAGQNNYMKISTKFFKCVQQFKYL